MNLATLLWLSSCFCPYLRETKERERERQRQRLVTNKHGILCWSPVVILLISYSRHGCWVCPRARRAMSPLTCWKRRSPWGRWCWSAREGDTPKSQQTSTPIQSCRTCLERTKINFSVSVRSSCTVLSRWSSMECANIHCSRVINLLIIFMVFTIRHMRICR